MITRHSLTLILLILSYSTVALAQEPTIAQCKAIIKDGQPKAAVDYCLGLWPSETGSGTSSDGGSSTSNEIEKFSIIKSESGELFTIKKLDKETKIPESIKVDELEKIDVSKLNKVDVQMREGHISKR